jgi:cell wall-associated NlpC family hydrolase
VIFIYSGYRDFLNMRLLKHFWFLAGLLTLAACTSPPIKPSIYPTGAYSTSPISNGKNSINPTTPEPPNSLSPDKAQGLAVYALGLVGTPYKWGGNTPDSGFDCSGLIGYVYQAQTGVKSPRTVSSLKNWGHEVSREQIRTGDILIFGPLNEPTHAGIYVGEDRFVHAPSTGGTVRLNKLTTAYWKEKELTIRRPLN